MLEYCSVVYIRLLSAKSVRLRWEKQVIMIMKIDAIDNDNRRVKYDYINYGIFTSMVNILNTIQMYK